jgi:GNAT superfamily N-acetyltransferase
VSTDPGFQLTAPEPRLHHLADGTPVLVRPLVQSDRAELVAQYGQLSSRTRRLRFVSAPAHLSDRLLDHLFDVDYVDRHALVATLIDEPGTPSVGVARYYRSRADPTTADAAVTVVDGEQGRGIGTLLLTSLVADAMDNGIEAFTADILWDNSEFLDALRAVGARVIPGEPGLATVRVDLPSDLHSLRGSPIYEVMRLAGSDPSP